jgi:hypothetical protein
MDENLFEPSTRLHDLVHAADDDESLLLHYVDFRDRFEEVELRAWTGYISAGECLRPNCTWDELWLPACEKLVWMDLEVVVGVGFSEDDEEWFYSLGCNVLSPTGRIDEDTEISDSLHLLSPSVAQSATTVCDYLLQLMTSSNSNTPEISLSF